MQLLSLPVELLLEIIKHVEDGTTLRPPYLQGKHDDSARGPPTNLASLSCASRELHALCEPTTSRIISEISLQREADTKTAEGHFRPDTTLLQLAAMQDNVPLAARLLALGADANLSREDFCGCMYDEFRLQSFSPLTHAVRASSAPLARLLVARGAAVDSVQYPSGRAALHHAAARGDLAMAEVLLDLGASVDVRTVDFEMDQVTLYPRGFEALRTPLFFAVEAGHHAVARLLLAKGADVAARDDRGRTCVHYLGREEIYWSRSEMMVPVQGEDDVTQMGRLLVEAQAEIFAVDMKGRSGLFHAVKQGLFHAIPFHLSFGLPSVDNKGCTPLHHMPYTYQEAEIANMIQQFLQAGFDLDARNNNGTTPTGQAIFSGRVPGIIMALLKAGARRDIVDNAGKTLADLAKGYYEGQKEELNRLLQMVVPV